MSHDDLTSTRQDTKLKILIGKAGLDGHDRGVKIVARALRDAGCEVVYTGVHQTPENIVETAMNEDIDGIGISLLSGAHLHVFKEILDLLNKNNMGDVPVFGGGVIPKDDIYELREMGVKTVFLPGTPLDDIVSWVKSNIQPRKH